MNTVDDETNPYRGSGSQRLQDEADDDEEEEDENEDDEDHGTKKSKVKWYDSIYFIFKFADAN